MKSSIIQNWLTTAFGILAGGPVLVTASCATMNLTLSPAWIHGLGIVGAVGLIGLGVVSKAFNTHSTATEVRAATDKANGN